MTRAARTRLLARPSTVAALYLALAIVMTWPLAPVVHRQIGGDLGDSLFNAWIMMWTGGRVLDALHGNLSALAHYWNAPIFSPAPLTLAYSEHLTPQMVQTLPLFAATGNIILCYNATLFGTIVLSGLGMYLFVRELTGQTLAAFLAGVAFAFAPYRIDQFAHIEVLSSQWMPFALYGFRRFFATGRPLALAGGAAALLVQGLSCGYYLAYFTPFAVAYCLYEMAARGKLLDGRTWGSLVAAGAAVLLVTAAVLWPYARVRQFGEIGTRPVQEIQRLSADTHAFGTIADNSRLWGSRIRAMPRVEGYGFPGFAILGFATAALAFGLARNIRRVPAGERLAPTRWRRWLALVLGATLLVWLFFIASALVTGRSAQTIAGMSFTYRPLRLLARIPVVLAALLWVSPWCRQVLRGAPGSTMGFFWCAALAAAWMSLGPEMYANGWSLGPGLYDVFYRWVPGFNGLRVASLNFMLVAFFLAVLAGLGAAAIAGRTRGRVVIVLGMIAMMAESWSVPIAPNATLGARGLDAPAARLREVSPLYRQLRDLPDGTVVVEFPFGDLSYEIQYTFYSGYHLKRILNGYSGFFPTHYVALQQVLSNVPSGAAAWRALVNSGATHAVVHERAYDGEQGRDVEEWLRRNGAKEIGAFPHGARLFQIR